MKKYGCFILVLLSLLIISCGSSVYKKELESYFQAGEYKVELEIISDEFGGFGEGFAIEVYKLIGKNLKSYILNKQLNTKSNTWKQLNWKSFSKSKENLNILELGLNYYSQNKETVKIVKDVNKLLDQSNVYMSCFYKPNRENPRSVIIYIVDCNESKVYIIESLI